MTRLDKVLTALALAVWAVVAVALTGCAAPRAQSPEQAYIVNAQGATSPAARSALNGSTAPGKQEIIGLYIPFVGTGLALKAGLEWDGTPVVIEVPMASGPQAAPQVVEEVETYYVPETRMVPKTRTVRRATVPVPQAAPRACPAPPPEPVAGAMSVAPDGSVVRDGLVVANAVPGQTWVIEGGKAVARGTFACDDEACTVPSAVASR